MCSLPKVGQGLVTASNRVVVSRRKGCRRSAVDGNFWLRASTPFIFSGFSPPMNPHPQRSYSIRSTATLFSTRRSRASSGWIVWPRDLDSLPLGSVERQWCLQTPTSSASPWPPVAPSGRRSLWCATVPCYCP